MTWYDDRANAHIDAALEALARAEPPRQHVEGVLARTSASNASAQGQPDATGGRGGALRRRPDLAGVLRPRWVLPIAATALIALGASWNVGRTRVALPAVAQPTGAVDVPHQTPRWGAPEDIDRPVLPPQAYWGMDPFAEFATLRPGAFEGKRRPTRPRAPASGREADAPVTAWVPVPTGLPPIELAAIAPVSIEVAPFAPLEDIVLAEIPLLPIVIAPLIEEEKP